MRPERAAQPVPAAAVDETVYCLVVALTGAGSAARSVHEHAGVSTDVVGPEDEGQNATPEAEMQIADGEEP